MEESGLVLFAFSLRLSGGTVDTFLNATSAQSPPSYIMQRDRGSLTCFATAWWVTWQDEEHDMIIRESCLSFLFPPPNTDHFMLVEGAVLAVLGGDALSPEQARHAHGSTAHWSRACHDTAPLSHPDGTAASFLRGKTTFRAEKAHQASSGVWPLLLHLLAKTGKTLKLENPL